jgi:hypothetical protein
VINIGVTIWGAKPTEPGVVPVTQGMTIDATWSNVNTDYLDTSGLTDLSARIDCSFNKDDTGVIWEQGGLGTGVILYVYNETLYFQFGSGAAFGTDVNRTEYSYPLTGTNITLVEFSISSTTEKGALYIFGSQVAGGATHTGGICGSDDGGIGRIHGISYATNRGGWTDDSDRGDFTGTVTKSDIFIGELTSEVQ